MPVCYTKHMKKYQIIYNSILNDIQSGNLLLNCYIPSEMELCKQFAASRVTIRKALFELERDGYIRKKQGRGSVVIRRGCTPKTVLLIVPNIFNYMYETLIQGIEETLNANNISLIIANSLGSQNTERNIIRNQIDRVDAVIFEPVQVALSKYSESKSYAKLLTKPTVCINSSIPEFTLPFIVSDNKQSMELLTKHVINCKVKRILVLAKTDELNGVYRLQGITSGLKNDKANCIIVEFNSDNMTEKLRDFAFLYTQYKPDCLMFYNDQIAYNFISEHNISCDANKVLVTGYDNTDYSNGHPYYFISPNQPKQQMGIDAANMIIKLLAGKQVQSIIYPPDIDFNK